MVGTNTDIPTTPGFQPPVNVQFAVFLDMRVGKMLELLETLKAQALTLAGLSVIDATDHAVVRLVTSNHPLARRLLQRSQFPFSESEVIVVETPPDHAIGDLCESLLRAELNIHYCYPLLVQPRSRPTLVISTDDNVLAAQVLRRKLYTLLGENDLGENAPGSDPAQN